MRILIDTCVLVDYLEDRQYADEAERVILNGSCYRMITAKTVLDLYYLIHHHTHSREETIASIKAIVDIMDEVIDTLGTDAIKALDGQTTDYEDAVMIETAKRVSADCIITRNIKDYKYSDILVKRPEEFLM